MHIKEIRLNGFKSYKQETVIQDFHKGLNVIIGRNGSGKSNLFIAIQLALTNEYSSMKPAERVALLSHGRNPNNPAYVEVIFDNTDRKLPFDDDTVTFRRMIACKKDRLLINGVDKTSDNSVLMSAGFLNPFYLVKQGKINEIGAGSDASRLTLVKEIAGVNCYEAKKIKTGLQLTKGAASMKKIEGLLKNLDESKANLLKETQDLDKFEKLDKKKRAIEYIITEREIEKLKGKITTLDQKRDGINQTIDPIKSKLVTISAEIEKTKCDADTIQRDIKNNNVRKSIVTGEMDELTEREARLVNTISEEKKKLEQVGQNNADYTTGHLTRRQQYREVKKKLEAVRPEYENLKSKDDDLSAKFSYTEQELSVVESQLKLSPKERIAALTNEVAALSNLIVKENKRQHFSSIKHKALEAELEQLEETRQRIQEELENKIKDISKRENEVIVQDQKLQQLTVTLRDLWSKVTCVDQKEYELQEEWKSKVEAMKRVAGNSTMNGFIGVQRIMSMLKEKNNPAAQEIVKGYHGLVIENFKSTEDYASALEVIGGKKLFYHIVQNRRIGSAIMTEFNKMGLQGEVAFLPLENVQIPHYNIPALKNIRMHLLLDIIQHDPALEKAIQFVFGGVLVCETLELATNTMKTYKLTCVTLDGDKVQRNGLMQGGHRDPRLSVIKVQEERVKLLRKISTVQDDKAKFSADAETCQVEIRRCGKEKEAIMSRLDSLKMSADKLRIELKLKQEKLRAVTLNVTTEADLLDKIKQNVVVSEGRIQFIESEKDRDVDAARETILESFQTIKAKLKEISVKKKKSSAKLLECQNQKQILEKQMQSLKDLQEEEERQHGSELSEDALKQRIKLFQSQADDVAQRIRAHKEKINIVERALSNEAEKLKNHQLSREELETEHGKLLENLCSSGTQLDRVNSEATVLNNSLMKFETKLKRFGSYPAELHRFQDAPTKDLFKKLEGVNAEVGRIEKNINRKAVDQLRDLETSLLEYHGKYEELQKDKVAMEKLVFDLDQKKSEVALKATQVLQKGFEEMFAELVPGGYGEMVMHGDGGDEQDFYHADGDDPDAYREALERWSNGVFRGISLRVTFDRQSGERLTDINHLSGGQKSIVALSLILAVQKSDPTVLYLFDEIDQALDPENRAAVAKKLKELSANAQFICTTFRKELVEEADNIFGVVYGHTTSHIRKPTREEAEDFVEEDEPIPDSSDFEFTRPQVPFP